MASDQQVDARILLQAIGDLKRRGIHRQMEELESREPDLASHIMEEISLIHQRLGALGGRPKATQQVLRQVQSLVLVVIAALSRAHYQLWQQENQDTPLSRLADEDPPPPPPSAPP